MLILIILLPLAAMLEQSLGQTPGQNMVSDVSEQQQKEIVDTHNANRRTVQPTASNMLKMAWSDSAAQSAKEWAAKCTGRRSPMKERVVNGLYCSEGTLQATYPSSWSEVVETWFKRRSNFQYGIGAVNPKKDIYSYTQLVWYNSYEVGCALAYCPQNDYNFFYVCRYCPAGNVQGQVLTPYKEGPPCADCPNNCEDKLCTNPCRYVDNSWGCKELKKTVGCSKDLMMQECQATCECTTEII